ncbi:hypothetical protein ACFWP7_30315 [Streptomyces sp. NPDC058470]|uniref:hypothetical protein n=1 Tax=Streptomyces sp. NPDC058470 TaxID=3346515 RepID=UPI00364B0D4A
MSGTRWEWRDSGSASGHMQRVADSGTYNRVQAAYRAYINHATACAGCGHGETKCATADELWCSYRAART